MNTIKNSLFRNPTFWSGVLIGCLITVLTLAGVGVYAQSGGDVSPGEPPKQVETGGTPVSDTPAGEDSMFAAGANRPQSVNADISPAITYQGVLKDAGQLANGLFDFSFILYDDPAAGSQIDEELVDGVSVANGQFTTLLDFGPEVYSSRALWLEIGVRPAGGGGYETLEPRQQLTAAPLALGLPNVTANPETGHVSIGGGQRLSEYEFLSINDPIEDWVGMFITGGGPNARPYYGYATDDEGGYESVWTEYNGGADEWQLHTDVGEVFAVSVEGDVRQTESADGLVKAAAYVNCWHDPIGVEVFNSFNTVNGAPVTAAAGPEMGQCYIDFGFDLTDRFFNATAVWSIDPRGVSCDFDPDNSNRLRCMRWWVVDAGTEGLPGPIMVTIN